MNPIRATARLFSCLLIGAAVTACGDGGGGAASFGEGGEPRPGGTVVIAELADMSIPLAIVAQSTLDGNLGGDVMFMALVAGAWEDGRLVFHTSDRNPLAMAHSYEYFGPDSASIRYHIRPDLRWSDGEPITARDVEYTYGIVDDPALASPLQHYKEFLDSVVAEDDSTVVFNFTRRHPDMLTHSALQPLPAHIFEGTPPGELRNHPTIRNPENGRLVVSGAYMIGGWQRGQSVTLVRNPHFSPAGHLDQVVFRVIPDATTRIVELQTGRLDMLTGITLDQVPALRAGAPNVRLEREEKRFYDYITYHPSYEPFADPEVRRALGLAIDVNGIVAALQMDEFAVPAGGPYAPIFRDLYDPVGQAPLPFDPDEARRILAAKGWRDTNNDGIVERNGRPFQFTLMTNAGNQRRADVTQIVQQQWRNIGIDARLQQLESNTFFDNMNRGDFQAALAGWSVGLSPDLTAIWAADSPFNYTNYGNAEVTALLEHARSQPTYESSVDAWRDVATRVVQDQPYTWLYYLDSVDGVSNRLRGTSIDTYGPYHHMWEWWVTDAAPVAAPAESGSEAGGGSGGAAPGAM